VNAIADRDRMTNLSPPGAAPRSQKRGDPPTRVTSIVTTMIAPTTIATMESTLISPPSGGLSSRAMRPAMINRGSGGAEDVVVAEDAAEPVKAPSGQHRNPTASVARRMARTSHSRSVTGAARVRRLGPPSPQTVQRGHRDPQGLEATSVRGGDGAPAAKAVDRRPSRWPLGRSHRRVRGVESDGVNRVVNPVLAANAGRGPTSPPYRAATTKTTRGSNSSGSRKRYGTGQPVLATMTPKTCSRRADSARCSMCRVGLRPSVS
jgi:hypothetical protein